MLKKRVAATILVKDGLVVQSKNFRHYLPVGKPEIAVEYLNRWGIDEIILLDMSASKKKREPGFDMIGRAARNGFVPLTVGGGITSIRDMERLMLCGADKVSLNQSALYRLSILTQAAHIFGDQCMVAAIDVRKTLDGYRVYDHVSGSDTEHTPVDFAKRCQDAGAGEILVNSVDRDGTYLGYDIELVQAVCKAVSVPVICSGGAGTAQHMIDVFNQTSVSAATAANFFHFSEHSVNRVKSLVSRSVDVRNEVHARYDSARLDSRDRLLKKGDNELEEMLFIVIPKEEI